jgi:exodeoxyribonuclease (lambda-induced)
VIYYTDRQGTEAWYEARRGVITGSRASDARNRTNGLTKQQNIYVDAILRGATQGEAQFEAGYKKAPASEDVERAIRGTLPLKWGDGAISYAMDLARERRGGRAPVTSGFAATRIGQEEEPFGRIAYMAKTGLVVEEVGFATTDDRKFGMSLDGAVPKAKGAVEIKTMVSSSTLFKAMVDGDISEYRDQCVFALWLFVLDWIDLCLWCPDLQHLEVIRIVRDEAEIQKLEDDLMAFESMVSDYEAALRKKLGAAGGEAPAPAAPTTAPKTIATKPAANDFVLPDF